VSRKLHIGNLSLGTTDDDLRELFSPYGAVTTAGVVIDKNTGRSRGFGFVEMDDGAESAILATHGRPFQGRPIVVNDAQPPAVRPARRLV
jgi:RNA recognition motif-containing protein